MSIDAYNRATNRENKLWTPFIYSFPFSTEQTTERVIIYGLYSNANGIGYLAQIEASELANMLANYNSKMLELTTAQQIAVAEITSKRYLAGIDKLIHDAKMETKSQAIAADDEMWTAKIAALDADRAALTTLAARVTSETTKISARITELEAYIAIEGIHLSEVEIEVLNKEIQLAKIDLEMLGTANEILRLQLEVIKKGMELVEVDLQVARTNNSIEGVKRQIARTDLLESELTVEQAHTDVAEAEKDLYAARTELARQKLEAAEKEVTLYDSLVSHETEIGAKKIESMEAEQARRLAAIADRQSAALYSDEAKKSAADFDATTATNSKTTQINIDKDTITSDSNRVAAHRLVDAADIEAAETLARANIATTIEHLIQKA